MDKLKEDLLEKKPRVVWMTPPCTTQRTTVSIKIKVSSSTNEHLGGVFLACEADWCQLVLKQMWSSTSLGRAGVFSELKEQFHSGRTPGCQWSSLADGTLSSKSWYFICSQRRWSELLCSGRCLHDHSHQTLEKETSQHTHRNWSKRLQK